MGNAPEWIVSTIDNRIVSVSLDYTVFADIMKKISWLPASSISEIRCTKIPTSELFKLSESVSWDDMWLFGTEFQKSVWKKLFGMTHPGQQMPRLMSYSDFAESCGNRPGVRAVAHAVAQNPIAVIIPCHLIVPKETIDRMNEIERQAENSLFGKDGLILDPTLDFG